MFLPPHQIKRTRENTLSNLQSLSIACLDGGQRLNELLANTSRISLSQGGKALSQNDSGAFVEAGKRFWQDNTLAPQFIDQVYEIFAETHKAMIEAAEAQIEVFDELVFASIERASNYSPQEAEIAFKAMHCTLQSAEQALHSMSDAAIQSVELSEQEIHQATEILAEKPKAATKAKPRAKPAAKPKTIGAASLKN